MSLVDSPCALEELVVPSLRKLVTEARVPFRSLQGKNDGHKARLRLVPGVCHWCPWAFCGLCGSWNLVITESGEGPHPAAGLVEAAGAGQQVAGDR